MKKPIVGILAFILTVCCLPVPLHITAAATIPMPVIEITSVSGQTGDEVAVSIIMQNNPGVAYLKLKIDYDSSLSIVRADNNDVLSGTFTTSKTTAVKPYVLQWMGASDSTENGAIATVTFRIAEGAVAGDKPVTVTVEECYNESFDAVDFSVSNGRVTVNTSSGDEPFPVIAASSVDTLCGEEVTLDISLKDNPGFAYLKLLIDYDDTALTLIEASDLGIIGGVFTTSKETTVRPYVLQWMGASDSTGNGRIATVTFRALKAGITAVSVSVAECYNAEFGDITIVTENGIIQVLSAPQYKLGDPDRDGEITVSDALTALRVAAKLADVNELIMATCDVDDDGEVTVSDALRILRVAAKLANSL